MSDGHALQEGTRIQLCGRFAARVAGRRIDRELPGRQGRLLFAYLVVNRDRVASRDELAEALWTRGLPSAPDMALSALLSKLRRLLPDGALESRSAIRQMYQKAFEAGDAKDLVAAAVQLTGGSWGVALRRHGQTVAVKEFRFSNGLIVRHNLIEDPDTITRMLAGS